MILSWTERLYSHIRTEIRFKLLRGSAVENIWTMVERLIQKYFMDEEGSCCKVLSLVNIMNVAKVRSPDKLCASSRGKTGGAGVIHHYWA